MLFALQRFRDLGEIGRRPICNVGEDIGDRLADGR